jgi:hypothetical protein
VGIINLAYLASGREEGPKMDVTMLANNLAVLPAPLLPYLLKAGEKAAEEAGKKLGGDAWDRAKGLWAKLRPKVKAKLPVQKAVQDAAATPNDEDIQAALRVQLKKLLAEDEGLAAEIGRLWQEAQQVGVTIIATGERSVAIGLDVTDSTIITGDQNAIKPQNVVKP